MLQVNNLSKSFSGRVILDRINYIFPSNKIVALVGVNGAGKTTFLNIISGIEDADSGDVLKSKGMVFGYLPQAPNPNPEPNILEECMAGAGDICELKLKLREISDQMEHSYTPELYEEHERLEHDYQQKGGYKLEANAEKILLGIGFKREQFEEDPKALSGGWRMRLELAKILLKNPDFLVLDEPTNHLDLPSIVWLEDYLKKFRGTLLFISHDEDLLNSLPNVIIHLKSGKLTEYQGNYDDFLEQYEENQAARVSEAKTLEKKIKQLNEFVDRFGAKASKATQARSKMKMISALRSEASNISIDSADSEMNLQIPITQKSGKDVIHLTGCSIGYNKPLVKNFDLFVERGQKVAIVGANGLGKSTLIKSIDGKTPFLGGEMKLGHNVKIGYYAQDQLEYLDGEKNVLENLMAANSSIIERKARQLLGSFLLKGDAVYKKVKVLSGGEKSRLSLACLLVQDVNVLLLDEPTNHLDMLSSEILAEALKNYEGTVMFVSHNRKFINSIATHVFMLSNRGQTYLSKGNLNDMLVPDFGDKK
jgi:ATP-binding cassette subfamily F protein 3